MESSLFAALPAELRDRIFEHVLLRDHPILISRPTREATQQSVSDIGMLLACRQFNAECNTIFYGFNLFLLKMAGLPVKEPDVFSAWKNTIGEHNVGALRHITIDIRNVDASTNDDALTACLLQDIAFTAAGCDHRCRVVVKLGLLTYRKTVKGVTEQFIFDVVLDARDLEGSLRREIQKMKVRVGVEEDEKDWLKPFTGEHHLGRLLQLLSS